jgi:FKBP-type peptidyl-prolyl cis-trans isomerase SlyD
MSHPPAAASRATAQRGKTLALADSVSTLVRMKIGTGLSVSIEYELKVKGGAVIESSTRSGPLRYQQGAGKMLPGLERRLEGLSPGDQRSGEIPAADAFGTEDSLPIKEMAPREFPAGVTPKAGLVFQAKGPHGEMVSFKVIAAGGDKVQVRLLHPLVGRDLEYKVRVLSVSDPHHPAVAPPLPPGVVELDLDEIKEA